ncbi:hypothetical protein HK102_000772 [Quaeritorhiza haematococci]|nr:hypothetical protein HK102_000772 [Quaeritorhiza haematococci]
MKAVQFSETGDIDVLKYVDVEKPAGPKPDEILVKNQFVGINFIDTYHRSGLYKVPLPYIAGREASGVVEAVGSEVKGFKPGDRVAYLAPNCYAEYNVAKAYLATHLPDSMTMEEGAALLLQGLTAMSLVKRAYEVKKGDYVLVHAAAGGTGMLLVQICKALGAFVIGTTSTPEKAAMAKKAGADEIILYTEADVVAEVKRITNGKGVHVVYDGVGKATFDQSLACLTRLGYMITFGNASGKVDPVDVLKLAPRAVRLMRPSLFEFLQDKEDFDFLANPLLELVNSKKVAFHIHKVYPLANVGEAQADLTGRKTQGKLILKV